MNFKFYILFLGIALANLIGYGQNYNKYCLYTDYAVKAYQNNNYQKAILLMDSAITKCPEENNNAANWYNLSLFYKTLLKQTKDNSLREKVLSSILKAKELDENGELLKNINSSIKNLAILYKNDAILILNDTSTHFDGALKNYDRYKSLLSINQPDKEFKNEDIEFYNVVAHMNNTKYENNKQLYSNHLDSAIHYYQKILLLEPNSTDTHEQLGILFFNQAVDIINDIDPEANLEIVMKADIKKAELALKSIPHFEKALKAAPSNSKIIYSLAGCYELLSLREKHEFYLKLLKEKDPKYYNEVYTYPSN